MPACFSEQGGSHRRGGCLIAPQTTGEITHDLRDQDAAKGAVPRRVFATPSEAPLGTRVYMRVADVFRDADVVSIDELRAARQAAVVCDDAGKVSHRSEREPTDVHVFDAVLEVPAETKTTE